MYWEEIKDRPVPRSIFTSGSLLSQVSLNSPISKTQCNYPENKGLTKIKISFICLILKGKEMILPLLPHQYCSGLLLSPCCRFLIYQYSSDLCRTMTKTRYKMKDPRSWSCGVCEVQTHPMKRSRTSVTILAALTMGLSGSLNVLALCSMYLTSHIRAEILLKNTQN